MKIQLWSAAPENATTLQRRNFFNVQREAIGIGIYAVAANYLPIFLTRLGASSSQVGLLTSIPALGGFLLTIPVGRFLQRQRDIVRWYGGPRLLAILSYALIGLLPFIVPLERVVPIILWIRAAIALPQTLVMVSFSVLMNAVAGPKGRYELLSRRWSILVVTTAAVTILVGQILDRVPFPLNYQLTLVGLSLGGLISFSYSQRIRLPDLEPAPEKAGLPFAESLAHFVAPVRKERAFLSFVAKRFVYSAGLALAVPLFPLYYVNIVRASDAWIGIFSAAQTATLLVGYYLWTRQSRVRGARFVLLCTTLALSLHPALTATTNRTEYVALYAGLSGIFRAGLDLVFFDELMKNVPLEYSATFVALSQSSQHFANMTVPLLGTTLADRIGLGGTLVASTLLRLIGFVLFAQSEATPTVTQE